MTRFPIALTATLSTAAVLGLAACASGGKPSENYFDATQRLAAECQARGGILAPTGGQSGRAETDNICKISGGASRLTRGS